jgi:hypothetical protein
MLYMEYCNGLSGEDITCATCVVLALLPQLHEHFPQQAYIRVTSCKQTRAVATRVIATTTQQYTFDHAELLYMIFCFTAFDATSINACAGYEEAQCELN